MRLGGLGILLLDTLGLWTDYGRTMDEFGPWSEDAWLWNKLLLLLYIFPNVL